jgi:hypothetical protein
MTVIPETCPGTVYDIYVFLTDELPQITQRNKSSYDVDNEMARNIASEIKTIISLSFLFNSKITVFHRYLYNNM